MKHDAKDLTKTPPASPRVRTRGYAILARAADKGRADIAGTVGEYHFDCPVDSYLFDFKGVTGDDFRQLLLTGMDDDRIAAWLDANGQPRTEEEKRTWSESVEAILPFQDPEMKDWFVEVCTGIGLDPETSTLFDYLEADDKACLPV